MGQKLPVAGFAHIAAMSDATRLKETQAVEPCLLRMMVLLNPSINFESSVKCSAARLFTSVALDSRCYQPKNGQMACTSL